MGGMDEGARSFEGVAGYRWSFNFLIDADGSESLEGLRVEVEVRLIRRQGPVLAETVTRVRYLMLRGQPLADRSHALPDLARPFEDRTDTEAARQSVPADRGKRCRRYAAAVRAVGISAELAGCNAGLEICRHTRGRQRKDAVFRRVRRRDIGLDHSLRHAQFRIRHAEPHQVFDDTLAVRRSQALGRQLADQYLANSSR